MVIFETTTHEDKESHKEHRSLLIIHLDMAICDFVLNEAVIDFPTSY